MLQLVTARADAGRFARFTYRRFQPLIGWPHESENVIAIGAVLRGEPAGLALGALTQDPSNARVLSLAVASEQRRTGIGTALAAALEQALAARKCSRISAAYLGDCPCRLAIEALLRKFSWESEPKTAVYRGRIRTVVPQLPWSQVAPLPPPFVLRPWEELTPAERERILVLTGAEGDRLERNSLALWDQAEIAGWCLTHRILPDTIRYTRLFVREDLRQRGHGTAMIAESLRRHYRDPLGSEAPIGMFHVEVDNLPMLHFAQECLAPFMEPVVFTYEASKRLLAPDTTAAGPSRRGEQTGESGMERIVPAKCAISAE